MSDFIQEFQFYMSYPFVRYALIVGVLIALCSSLLGVTLVLKRFSFIGDGLSHVAFGALAIATVLKIADVNLFIMPVTIICAVHCFGLLGQNFTGQECVLLLSGVGISCVLRFEPLFCCLLAVSLGMAVCVGRTMFVPDLPGACNPLFPFP